MDHFNFQPVIIIGAGRSGTNMIRDLLTARPGFGTWPCDEINYIWRYGHARFENDEFPSEFATARVKTYIRKQFARQAAKLHCQWLVEKTCANSLRVEYVQAILPEAKYIFLVRNGLDVSLSAERRWQAPLELKYLSKKAAFVPWADLPYYAARYGWHRCRKVFDREHRLPTWGPRFHGLDECAQRLPVREVALRQWQICVDRASKALSCLHPRQVHFLRYESFVTQPVVHLEALFGFLGLSTTDEELTQLAKRVSGDRVGKGDFHTLKAQTLVHETLDRIDRMWDKNSRSAFKQAA